MQQYKYNGRIYKGWKSCIRAALRDDIDGFSDWLEDGEGWTPSGILCALVERDPRGIGKEF